MIYKEDEKYCCSKCGYIIDGKCQNEDNDKDIIKESVQSSIDGDINNVFICLEFIKA